MATSPYAAVTEGLVEVARSNELRDAIRSWNPQRGVDPLVADVEQEAVAAALWEVLWRFVPDLNRKLHYQATSKSPNPFLLERATQQAGALTEWPYVVATRDPDAAQLLATAIRVEADPAWHDTESIVARYIATLKDIRETEQAFPTHGEVSVSALDPIDGPRAQANHLQEMITRLLLLGDPKATSRILIVYAIQLALDLPTVAIGSQADVILDHLVPPLNLAIDRFTHTSPRAYAPQLLRAVGIVRKSASSQEARSILSGIRRRLVISLMSDRVLSPLKLLRREQQQDERIEQDEPVA